ncbi:MAG: hypothetical protein JXR37_11815 [Kiritimatiellae bacterium]|nr:hypothetical protein [Kiritimatiellia bacterium]
MRTRMLVWLGLILGMAAVACAAPSADPALPESAPEPPTLGDAILPDMTLTETAGAAFAQAPAMEEEPVAVEEAPAAPSGAVPAVPAPRLPASTEEAPVAVEEIPAEPAAIEPAVELPPLEEEAAGTVEPAVPAPALEEIPAAEGVVTPAEEVVVEDVLPTTDTESVVLKQDEDIMKNGAEPTQDQNLITVTLDEVPLQDVVRMFTRISGANIIATGTNLQGTVTVNLEDVEWKPALSAILDMHGLALIEKPPDSGVYSIVTRPPNQPDPLIVETLFLKYASVSNVFECITPLLGTGKAVQFPSRNALIVQATEVHLKDIEKVVAKIDHPRKQVFIEAKFVELNDSAIRNLGINWQLLQNFSLGVSGLSSSYAETRRRSDVESQGAIGGQIYGRSRGYTLQDNHPLDGTDAGSYTYLSQAGEMITRGKNISNIEMDEEGVTMESIIPFESEEIRTAILNIDDFRLVLSALKEIDGVDIVSNPKIIVANEEEAKIHIGEREPNVRGETTTPESGAPVTTYNLDEDEPYFEFGIQLNVIPTINTENNITLRITPSLTRFIRDKVAPDGNTFPVTAKKEINTIFTLQNEHTVAIGGLTESQDREDISKVPLLGDIPLIGKYLFTHTRKVKDQNETIIFVTVGLASPDTLIKEAGIPEDGRLIHRHLARRALESEE